MRANRREPESVPFWFQSINFRPYDPKSHGRPHGGFMPSGAPSMYSALSTLGLVCSVKSTSINSSVRLCSS